MKVYFKNLDGLRFIAALFVILEHACDYKTFAVPYYSNVFSYYFNDLGRYGVTLFFVLSGFLISYLLFSEINLRKRIDVKKFYLRRILRTWPLYLVFGTLVICLLGFILKKIDGGDYSFPVWTNLICLYTFTINNQLLFGTYNRGIFEIAWSVCVEEQFYIIWPWLIKAGFKKMQRTIFIFIGVGIISGIIMHLLNEKNIIQTNRNPLYMFTVCRFSHFGIGAYAAFMLYHKQHFARIISYTKNKILQVFAILITLLICFKIISLPTWVDNYFLDTLPALLFGFIILSAVSGNFIFNLEVKWLKFPGKYSYGIYMFHPTIGQLGIVLFKKIFSNNFFNYDILYFLFIIIGSICVAAISYEIFEKRFLQIKRKYTIIKNHPA